MPCLARFLDTSRDDLNELPETAKEVRLYLLAHDVLAQLSRFQNLRRVDLQRWGVSDEALQTTMRALGRRAGRAITR